MLEQPRLLVTDTTFRDAHQSLLATRMRTHDMLRIAPFYAARLSGLFSLEMWGGATFDTAMRFLKESPWQRLVDLRSRMPNILFQMLLRSASAVGYTNYPDNVVQAFVKESAQAGIDLFRIFDALNGLPNLQLAIEAVRDNGMLCEAAICYTGDILDPSRTKYNLAYYVNLAKELEKRGANLLAIKDMAGLCKPYAAQVLVRTLRQEVGLPIHFHTHDCAGGQIASYLLAAEEGVSIVDCAMAPFSSMTSQPSLHALVEALRFDRAIPPWTTTPCRRSPTTGRGCGGCTPPSRPANWRRRRTCISTRCPADSTPTCTTRRRRWGWRDAGARCAGCTPRSIACSATSSR